MQFSRFAPRPISSSSFRLFSPASSLLPLSPLAFFTFSPSFFHSLPQLFSLSPPAFFHFLPQLFLSRPRFRGAPSIIWINYAHALYSGVKGRGTVHVAVMSKKARMEQAKAFLQEANSILCSLDESPGTSSTSFKPVSRAFREFLGYS